MEIATWFGLARDATSQPFADMQMAELATYSIVWALFAVAVVVAGFLLKSRFYRMIGLLAFGPILAKVFLSATDRCLHRFPEAPHHPLECRPCLSP